MTSVCDYRHFAENTKSHTSLSFTLDYVLKGLHPVLHFTSLYLGRIMHASDTHLLFKGLVMLAKLNVGNSSKPCHYTLQYYIVWVHLS